MILTVTLNAALDLTYDVAELVPGSSHRVQQVRRRAGGKGINVSSVLAATGVDAVATGFIAGGTGQQILADLRERCIPHRFVDIDGDSRHTVNITCLRTGDATIFNEPGPVLAQGDWQRFLANLDVLLEELDVGVVVVSGSLPPGAPADAYRQIVDKAHHQGAACIVDADGPALLHAVHAGPEVIKPNRRELADTTAIADPLAAARNLQARGATTIVISDGAAGALLVPLDGPVLHGRLPNPLRGNPTGAGDAMVAAIAAALHNHHDWQQTLQDGIAWSAAAVLQPNAGEVNLHDLRQLSPSIETESL